MGESDAVVTGIFLFVFLLFGIFCDDYGMLLKDMCAVAGMNRLNGDGREKRIVVD